MKEVRPPTVLVARDRACYVGSMRPWAALAVLLLAGGRTSAADASGASLFRARCALCHEEGGGRGPSLAGVVGRRAGSTPDASEALRAAGRRGLVWSARTLDWYLAAPGKAVPGTTMTLATPDAGERRELVRYLAALAPGRPAQAEAPPVAARGAPGSPPAAPGTVLSGPAAFGDWRADAPGVRRRIGPQDLPAPFATRSARASPRVVAPPAGAAPKVPPGFAIARFAEGLENPRQLRVAPNGDVFVAETGAGRVRVLRAPPGAARPERSEVFADRLDGPFGIAFHPPGAEPTFVYVATENAVVRFPYRSGDLRARGAPETVVARLAPTSGGHTTRDVVFSADGRRMFVSVGSASNVAEDIGRRSPEEVRAWEAEHGLGAAWGDEERRADVLVFDPEGKGGRTFATGLRNCVGMAVHPRTGDLWCSTNERDGMGDDLVPDYVTRVREGATYGWPWYYVGANEEPRLKGARPDLAGKVTVPDVLVASHSASLGMTFYDAPGGAPAAFPPEYRGDGFAAFHGSWNRSKRTGYKIVRVPLREGVPTGEYEDFVTGFVVDDLRVWGRPVGVAVAKDGALLFTEDGNGTVWRVAPEGK